MRSALRPITYVRTPACGLLILLRREQEEMSPGTVANDQHETNSDDEKDAIENPINNDLCMLKLILSNLVIFTRLKDS